MRTLFLLSAVFACGLAGASNVHTGGLPPIRIILVGDSTMAVRTGYGPGFCAGMRSEVTCLDMAKGGRSTKSYREEGSWDEVLQALRSKSEYQATYVLIQFGHNDQPNKPGRSTDLAIEFPANLRRFAEEVKAMGAKPVLVTPLTRRMFRDGKVDDTLGPWAAGTRKAAAEESVPLLDLYRESSETVQNLGPIEANSLAMAPPPPLFAESARTGTSRPLPPKVPATGGVEPPGDPGPVFDYTHLGSKGATFFGRMVANELASAIPSIRPYINQQ